MNMLHLAPALDYYLSTNSTNIEIGINKLDTMLTLVRCDINNLLFLFYAVWCPPNVTFTYAKVFF